MAPDDRDRVGALSRIAPCDRCLHDEHLLRCDAVITDGVHCPCRSVPRNGIDTALTPREPPPTDPTPR